MADAAPDPVKTAAGVLDPDGRPSRRVVRGLIPPLGPASTARGFKAAVVDTVPAPPRVR